MKVKRRFIIYIIIVIVILLCTFMFTADSVSSQHIRQRHLNLPDQVSNNILDFCVLRNNIIRVTLTDSSNNLSVWETNLQNTVWNKVIDIKDLIKYDPEKTLGQAFLLSDGRIVCEIMNIRNDDKECITQFYVIKNNKITENWSLKLPFINDNEVNVINDVSVIDSNNLLLMDLKGTCYVYDVKQDCIEKEFMQDGDCLASCVMEETMIELTDSALNFYDIISGKKNTNKVLYNILKNSLNLNNNIILFGQYNKLYISSDTGIYEIDIKQQCLRIILNTQDTILKNNYNKAEKIIVSQDNIFIYYSDLADGNYYLSYYYYSLQEYTKELNIYSLRNSYSLSRAIKLLEMDNPDLYINYEMGLKNDTEDIESVISNFNSLLLSGNGPDVIILDGLPIDLYIDSNKLIDLKEYYSKQIESSIIHKYIKRYQGYVIPTRFVLLGIAKERSIADNYINMYKFSSANSFEDLAISLYYQKCQNLGEDKENTKLILTDYFNLIKQIYANKKTDINSISNLNNPNLYFNFLSYNYYDLINGETDYSIDYITWIGYDIPVINSKLQPYNKIFTFFKPSDDTVFIPNIMVGINRDTHNDELSYQFLDKLLSKEIQSLDTYDGMPIINEELKKSLKLSEIYQNEWGIHSLDNAEKEKIIEIFGILNTSAERDIIEIKSILEMLELVIYENIEIDNAVDSLMVKLFD